MTGRKWAARLIDLALLIVIAIAPVALAVAYLPGLMASPAGEPPSPLMLAVLVWMVATLFLYMPIFESSPLKASPGKLITGLEVVRAGRKRMTFSQAMFRVLFGPLLLYFLPMQRRQFSGDAIMVRRGETPDPRLFG